LPAPSGAARLAMPAAVKPDFECTRTASAGGMRYAAIGSDPVAGARDRRARHGR
jgi:hypothetical protein